VIVDSHHHLWDPAARRYPWMTGPRMAPIRRRYGLDDLLTVTSDNGVDRTILVQTVGDVTETEEFLRIADDSGGLVVGVVGWVDLAAPDIAATIGRLLAGPGGHLLVGIRHQVEDEPDRRWLSRPDVRRGVDAVGAAGLVYDLLVSADCLTEARDLVADQPTVTFVLDHAAKPPLRSGDLDAWRAAIADLATLPNVNVKLSGLVTEADWDHWRVDDLRSIADHLLATFGATRMLFGSDWPVCELAASYSEVLAAARACLGGLTVAERDAVLGGNAQRVYRV
jgi:L-fucono-1,5-lactonase